MRCRDFSCQLVSAVLVTSMGMQGAPAQAQMHTLEDPSHAVEKSGPGWDGQPHLARWAEGQAHGAIFLHTESVLDLAAPTPESLGFAVLVRKSSDGFFVLQVVGGGTRAPLVMHAGEWAPVTEADRAWIQEIVPAMSQKLGDSVSRLSILGEGIVRQREGEHVSRWSGSSKSGFPALSMDSARRIVQAAWLDEGRRYGVYGVLDEPGGEGLRPPTGVDDFRYFLGFRWDPTTQRLDVVGPDSYTVSGEPHSSQAGEELRVSLMAGVVSLMRR